MASESDHAVLLGEESEGRDASVSGPSRTRAVLGLGFGAIGAVALWHSGGRNSAVSPLSLGGIMSASLTPNYKTICEQIEDDDGAHWPHRFQDVNWEGHCSEGGDITKCADRLVEKYVGDYFDAFLAAAIADADQKKFIPESLREQARWKDRAVEEMQHWAKTHQMVTVGGNEVLLINALAIPVEFGKATICKVIEDERPAVVETVGDCRPSYATWEDIARKLRTVVPAVAELGTQDSDTGALDETFPAELGSDTNTSIEKCRRLLRHSSNADSADYIEASLTGLDVRACLHSGGEEQPRFSRSWVGPCIPKNELGYPGFVFQFIGEYGLPGEDCVHSHGSLETGHCPSLCENGESLAGHLKRPDGEYHVIFNGPAGGPYIDLTPDQHKVAKQHIYNEGPILGLIAQTKWLAACARDDRIIYDDGCKDADDPEWQTNFDSVHSIVVHGWGSEGGIDFYRVVTSFQEDDHEARINQCAIKFFVIPKTTKGFASSDYDKHLQAIKAEARCPRYAFCNANGGYTDTEDCDGDGVLDHWCYIIGDAETPTYEAFISSRHDCETVERSCRRSVLPGRHFGCQRPLGWCMHGEEYRRDVDCDGDGHFDHVCDKPGHHGFISSVKDCTDSWEEGLEGVKCEPAGTTVLVSDKPYRLVSDYGNCVQHDSEQCFSSHAEWPHSDYPVGVCQFHVEWTQPPVVETQTASCDTEVVPNETLWLEVVQMDIEGAVFNENGWLYGERLMVNGINTKTNKDALTERNAAEFVKVNDKDIIKWSTDESVQEPGWLVCLRLKKKIPKVHKATCSEIGTDIWSDYFTTDVTKTVVSVECDEKACSKAKVDAVGTSRFSFVLTTNVCDAGWQAARSNKFDLAFSGPSSTSEATFEVLL